MRLLDTYNILILNLDLYTLSYAKIVQSELQKLIFQYTITIYVVFLIQYIHAYLLDLSVGKNDIENFLKEDIGSSRIATDIYDMHLSAPDFNIY